MMKSLTTLACGTFGLGMAEFLMMGTLSSIAVDLHVSIPTAGHFIAAYALGVSVGVCRLPWDIIINMRQCRGWSWLLPVLCC